MSMEIEFYPMPSFPMLYAVRDLAVSSRWYQDVLGFQLVFEMPGPPGAPVLIHLRWAKYADVLLVTKKNTRATSDISQTSEAKGVGVSLTFAMTQGSVDNLAAKIAGKGGSVASGPVNQPWNAREITVFDLDGYRLVFTKPIDKQKSMEDVVDNVKKSSN